MQHLLFMTARIESLQLGGDDSPLPLKIMSYPDLRDRSLSFWHSLTAFVKLIFAAANLASSIKDKIANIPSALSIARTAITTTSSIRLNPSLVSLGGLKLYLKCIHTLVLELLECPARQKCSLLSGPRTSTSKTSTFQRHTQLGGQSLHQQNQPSAVFVVHLSGGLQKPELLRQQTAKRL